MYVCSRCGWLLTVLSDKPSLTFVELSITQRTFFVSFVLDHKRTTAALNGGGMLKTVSGRVAETCFDEERSKHLIIMQCHR